MKDIGRENEAGHTFPTGFLAVIYLLLLVFFLAVLFISIQIGKPIQNFAADPAYLLDYHPLVGVISNLGALFWCAAAAVCLFTYYYLRRFSRNNDTSFLLYSGLLTILLLFDDFFMLHEELIPNYLFIPEVWVYVIYILLALAWLTYFREQLLQGEYKILGIAIFFLGLSVIADLILPQDKEMVYLIEEGLKFYGIITWLIYFARDSVFRLRKNLPLSPH